jgi:hypothetical protein
MVKQIIIKLIKKVGEIFMFTDILDFFKSYSSIIENREIDWVAFLINFIIVLVYFSIKEGLEFKETKPSKFRLSVYIREIIVSTSIGSIVLLVVGNNGLFFAPILACLATIKIKSMLEDKSNNKKDSSTNTTPVSNTVNVNINTNEDDELNDFYNPNIKLFEKDININNLDIIMILELYGYISPNHKYKMITSSLFENPEEQVMKLLDMHVLEESEYREAKAILNLIKLKKRLVTKEEALKYIMNAESTEISNKGGVQATSSFDSDKRQ